MASTYEFVERSLFLWTRPGVEKVIGTKLKKKREKIHLRSGHTDSLQETLHSIHLRKAYPVLDIYRTPELREVPNLPMKGRMS